MRCTSLSGFCHRAASHLLLPPRQCPLYVDDTKEDSSVQSHNSLSCPIELGLTSYFVFFPSYLGVFQWLSLLFLSSSLYIQAQSSHSGESRPAAVVQ